jgi:HAE1 family hydrophobic/amphiphilic exporter-1
MNSESNLPSSLSSQIIGRAVSRPIALCMITSAIVVFGIVSLMRLPIELLPEVDRPTITVRTELQGAAPEEVEERVARRLEKSLSVVSGLRRISSLSRIGTCDVILEFSWGQDLAEAIQDIREKLDQANLPERAESPSILRYDPRLDPVLLFGLSGSADLGRLRVLAEEEVERRLETVPGVAAVRVRGGLEEEILVEVSEERVRNRGLSIELISRRLAEENFDQASGLLEDGDVDYILRVRNEVVDSDDILSIPLLREGLSVVRLGDVADVRRSFQEDRVITRIDGQPAVFVEVLKEGDANIISVSKRVRERVFGTAEEQRQLQLWQEKRAGKDVTEESRGGFSFGQPGDGAIRRPDHVASWLPPGTSIDLLSDQADFIEGSINDLRQTALVGGLLAMLVLYLFLGKLSTTLVVAMGEFGRTPKINKTVGRDHYPRAGNVLLAGAGIPRGQIVGATDAKGYYAAENVYTPEDFAASLYHKLGIDPHQVLHTATGRPVQLVDGGSRIKELFA